MKHTCQSVFWYGRWSVYKKPPTYATVRPGTCCGTSRTKNKMDAAGSWGSGIASTETESTCLWLGKATTTTATSQQRASGQESALSSATQNSLTVRQQIGLACNFRKAKILAPGPTWWLLLWAPYQINRIWTWWSQQDLYVEISHLEIIRDFLAIQLESCSKTQIKNLSVPCQLQFFAFQKKGLEYYFFDGSVTHFAENLSDDNKFLCNKLRHEV